MRKALLFTAYNRLSYLASTISSWEDVRGLEDWDVYVSIEPSDVQNVVWLLFSESSIEPKLMSINDSRLGVLEHPFVAINKLFEDGYDFVVRAEDDLCVSTDILEYFSWAAEEFKTDTEVSIVNAYSDSPGVKEQAEVRLTYGFSPWVWGTWRRAWDEFIRDTWDHDYSTNNGAPGFQSGWDWNLNTRVLHQRGKRTLTPTGSRVDNIGVLGTHSLPENYRTALTYAHSRPAVQYELVR